MQGISEIKFTAEKIKIKPPGIDETIKIELSTGVYSLAQLAPAFVWQGEMNNYEIIIRKIKD